MWGHYLMLNDHGPYWETYFSRRQFGTTVLVFFVSKKKKCIIKFWLLTCGSRCDCGGGSRRYHISCRDDYNSRAGRYRGRSCNNISLLSGKNKILLFIKEWVSLWIMQCPGFHWFIITFSFMTKLALHGSYAFIW